MIRRILIGFAAAFAATLALAVDTHEPFDDPVLEARYQSLIREIRCPKCQNETIADSNAEIAADLRRQVRERVAAGDSEQEIVEFLRARYGDFVLYRPQLMPSTWALWAGPFVVLAVGALAVWRVLARRTAQPLDEDPAT